MTQAKLPGSAKYRLAAYSLEITLRRPRSTAKPPASIVSPAMAEAGSISGALTGLGLPDGAQIVMNQRLMHFELSVLAEATPARVINTSARLIFRTTVMSSN